MRCLVTASLLVTLLVAVNAVGKAAEQSDDKRLIQLLKKLQTDLEHKDGSDEDREEPEWPVPTPTPEPDVESKNHKTDDSTAPTDPAGAFLPYIMELISQLVEGGLNLTMSHELANSDADGYETLIGGKKRQAYDSSIPQTTNGLVVSNMLLTISELQYLLAIYDFLYVYQSTVKDLSDLENFLGVYDLLSVFQTESTDKSSSHSKLGVARLLETQRRKLQHVDYRAKFAKLLDKYAKH